MFVDTSPKQSKVNDELTEELKKRTFVGNQNLQGNFYTPVDDILKTSINGVDADKTNELLSNLNGSTQLVEEQKIEEPVKTEPAKQKKEKERPPKPARQKKEKPVKPPKPEKVKKEKPPKAPKPEKVKQEDTPLVLAMPEAIAPQEPVKATKQPKKRPAKKSKNKKNAPETFSFDISKIDPSVEEQPKEEQPKGKKSKPLKRQKEQQKKAAKEVKKNTAYDAHKQDNTSDYDIKGKQVVKPGMEDAEVNPYPELTPEELDKMSKKEIKAYYKKREAWAAAHPSTMRKSKIDTSYEESYYEKLSDKEFWKAIGI